MIRVKLTPGEIAEAGMVGLMRRVRSLKDRHGDMYGADGRRNGWQMDVGGALGEFAAAKGLNRFWAGAHDPGQQDIGFAQVRTTPYPNGQLVLHDRDADDDKFIHVVGSDGDYILVGWVFGREGKDPSYFGDKKNTGRPAYWVPDTILRPMETIFDDEEENAA